MQTTIHNHQPNLQLMMTNDAVCHAIQHRWSCGSWGSACCCHAAVNCCNGNNEAALLVLHCFEVRRTVLSFQVANNKRYAAAAGKGFTVSEVAEHVKSDFGTIDILVHSLANGPEVTKPLLETSRRVSNVAAYNVQQPLLLALGCMQPHLHAQVALCYSIVWRQPNLC